MLGRFTRHLLPSGSAYHATSGEDQQEGQGTTHRRAATSRRTRASDRNSTARGNTVDRNTSIRSIMTLPAYRQTASTTEQVIGREGDRDGVDVIVDLPTAEEEEAAREEEMETIYQVRLARRDQNSAREDRNRERREARERNDRAAIEDIRTRATAATRDTTVEDLRREVSRIKDNRQRSVSSVSYGDLGVARHDGTRIRANSNETERMGLLSDAASIALSTRSGAVSPGLHQRHGSASSVRSIDSADGRITPRPGDRAGSSPELVEADPGGESMPPPEYEDVSLEDDDADGARGAALARSTTPLHEPPPDYPGPYRTDSDSSGEVVAAARRRDGATAGLGGAGDAPQLPRLNMSEVPEIVIDVHSPGGHHQ